MLAAGTQFGPYKILAPLGAGGMGEVYRAKDCRLDREVAVKVLPEQFADDAERLARFEREAKAIAALSHPNILSIHDFGTHAGNCFAVMELLEGETLRSRLAQSTLDWRTAIETGAAITDGLASAHAKGVIHRDLKPENLFLTADGLVKILDFGLARIDAPPSPQADTAAYAPAETEPGAVMGTVGYMSPEQIRGKPVDVRSDIFSFGCVLYEMLAGKRPFARETRADVLAATLNDDPLPFPATLSEIPGEVERIVRRCLEKTAERRYQSARDLALDLRATQSSSGLSRTLVAVAPERKRRFLVPSMAVLLAAVMLAAALGAFAYFKKEPSARTPQQLVQSDTINAFAALPFDSAGQDGTADELSEGIPDGIIKNLYTLRGLKVRPFSSVLSYKGQSPDAARLREELKVQAVLTGRIAQKGDMLSISVNLVDVRDDSVIWAEIYRRNISDVLALQDEISRVIARKLRVQLSGEEEKQLAKVHTTNSDAFQLYVKGRYYFNKSTPQDVPRAMDCFNQAIAMDPNYAQAYAALAECYYWQSNIFKAPVDVIPQAMAAVKKAIQIDDSFGEAHALVGLFLCLYDWDFAEGEKSFQRAVELSPNSAMVRTYYGLCLAYCEQFERSRAELRQARELDPSSFFTQLYTIFPLYFMRAHDDSIAQLQTALELNPDNFLPYAYLGLAYEQKHEYPKAIAAFEKAIELGTGSEGKAQLAHIYASAGNRDEAIKWLDTLKELSKTEYVSPYNIALIYAGLGDRDETFAWLKKASEDHSEWYASLRVDPRLESVRSDPRFGDLLRHLKFTP